MRIANIVSPGDEHLQPSAEDIDHDVEVTTFVTRAGVEPLHPLRLAMRDLAYVDAALQAEAAGAAGVFVNSAADWGIDLIRAAVRIPVAAGGETAMAAALEKAANFSIVSVWSASTAPFYDRIMQRNGTADRCVSMRFVLDDAEMMQRGVQPVMLEMKDARSAMAERVLRVCESAVRDDGAEAIVLGCTCMAGLTAALSEALPVPVLNPLHEGFTAVAMAARAGAPTGPGADPETVAMVAAAVEAWAAFGTGEAGDCDEACEVLS